MTLYLPVPPAANNMYFNRRRGRAKSAEYRAWITEASLVAYQQGFEVVTVPAWVIMQIPENGRRDVDGYAKPILDLLVTIGMLLDDRCKYVRGLTMDWYDGDLVAVDVVTQLC